MDTIYSDLKPLWHRARLDQLAAGKIPAPVHLQLVLSDLCNQDCVAEGTAIACPGGPRRIEEIAPGDTVIGPHGGELVVENTSCQWAEGVYEIRVGNDNLRVTGNHKVLTQRGWIAASELQLGDAAVVRVRVRTESEVEPAPQEIRPLRIRAFAVVEEDRLRRLEEDHAAGRRRRDAPAVSLRLRDAGYGASSWGWTVLGGLCPWSPDGGSARDSFVAVAFGSGGTHALAQSDERSGGSAPRVQNESGNRGAVEDRAALIRVREEALAAGQLSWKRALVDQPSQPGFQGHRPEKNPRSDDQRNLQWLGSDPAISGGLWSRFGRSLREIGVALLGRILPSGLSSRPAGKIGDSDQRICVAGFRLERGLGLRNVTEIRRIDWPVLVYNLSVPPVEAYVAAGVVVANCSFCSYRMSGGLSRELFVTPETHNPNRRMPKDKAIQILTDAAAWGVRAVQFTGGGEPTVHKDHTYIFRTAQGLGLDTALVTNGLRLQCEEAFLRMKWVRVSVDAGQASTYARVRGVGEQHWSVVWDNLRDFARQYKGRLGVGFVVTPDNYREIADCAARCADVGIQNLRVGAVFSEQGEEYYGDLDHAIRREIDRARAVAGPVQVHSMFDRRMGDLHAGSPTEPFCGYQYLTTYVGADLGVYRCCNTAYTLRGKCGDLTHQSFSEYLAGRIGDGFDARECTFCQFRGQNRAIEQGLRSRDTIERPDDPNFV